MDHISQIPQRLEHGWLVTDLAPDRHMFMPGTRAFAFDGAPALPGAARAYLEALLPMQTVWAHALADEAAPWYEAEQVTVFGPTKGAVDDWAARYLVDYDFLSNGNPKPGGVIDRVLGPFHHPYPGEHLNSWVHGNGAVADWARAVSDATNPKESRTRRQGAGKTADRLQNAADAAWDEFRTALALWEAEARPWIQRGGKPPEPARPSHRPINLI